MNIDFPNLGYLMETVPIELFSKIKNCIDNIEHNPSSVSPANYKLQGHILKEVELEDLEIRALLEKYIVELFWKYDRRYDYIEHIRILTADVSFEMTAPWINFQQAGEYNPIHQHSGIMSFVLWVTIPYTMEEERCVSLGRQSNNDVGGVFQFAYTNSLGRISFLEIHADKKYEGKILLFPSSLSHSVYPFYSSDKTRISISGNLLFKTN